MSPDLLRADRGFSWRSITVCVAGIGVSGVAAARALLQFGARVIVLDAREGAGEKAQAAELEALGAQVRLGQHAAGNLPACDLLVTSPGWLPSSEVFVQAAAARIPVWGEVELAWRLRDPAIGTQWLGVTGTNGKTTATRMLESMLKADGRRAIAVGNVGTPLLHAVLDPEPYDVLACELSSFQLHWTTSLALTSAVVLNVAPDHVDWHGSLQAYAADKGRIYERAKVAAVYNVADEVSESLVRAADVEDGCRAIGFTTGVPAVGMVGVADGLLLDRAFVDNRHTHAVELAQVSDVQPAAPHNVANALAAAALARSIGVTHASVAEGLRQFVADPHRIAQVDVVDSVTYIDDSKATNPHAAQASLATYSNIVWVAGGLAKGAQFDELVLAVRDHLRAVVLIGADKRVIAEALARHAPQVHVVEVLGADTGDLSVMDAVVRVAADLARPGDTVLLAPACASMDMFANYNERGDAFAQAVVRRKHK